MKFTRRKARSFEEHKKPNKKMKRSILSTSSEEGNTIKEFNMLPVDVIVSIFTRCQVKALSMLRCTSKSWDDFITSPLFVHAHLKDSMEKAQVLFLEPKELRPSYKCTLRFVSVDMERNGVSNDLYAVTLPSFPVPLSTWIVCAGLVCLSTAYRLYLCNPVTKQLCKLPKCSTTAFPSNDNIGFGYRHLTKEYKVVRFFYWCPGGRCKSFEHLQLRCEVYTLNEVYSISTRWKEISDVPPCYPCRWGLLVNGDMYWPGKTDSYLFESPDRILSFDFETEKFLIVSWPSSFESLYGLNLMDLKGMLCVPDVCQFRKSSILDLWILKDRISCAWVKEYSINFVNFVPKNIIPFFKTWDEEVIFIHSDMVMFYDLKRKCFREGGKLPIIYRHGVLEAIGFGIYQKTMFSLGST